jgi:hypothetical protein
VGGCLGNEACLVINGYEHVPGEDFDETFSPFVRQDMFWFVMALAAANRLPIHQMDVSWRF